MSTSSQRRPTVQRTGSHSVSEQQLSQRTVLLSIGGVVVALLLILFFVAGRPRSSGEPVKNWSLSEAADRRWLEQVAMSSGGDFNRLSPQDQQRANTIAKGGAAGEIAFLFRDPQARQRAGLPPLQQESQARKFIPPHMR